jgi:hypothetical protein
VGVSLRSPYSDRASRCYSDEVNVFPSINLLPLLL